MIRYLQHKSTKLVNAPKGYDSVPLAGKRRWYQHPLFPLMPLFDYTPADQWNASRWSFTWLFVRVWTLEHFALEASAELESTGLNLKFIVGWLRIVLRLIPVGFDWTAPLHRGRPMRIQGEDNHHG